MTKKQRSAIIRDLANLSHGGWTNATPSDYQPLEAALAGKKLSDNEQTNFVMAVDHLFATVTRLRDVAYADNWDRDLDKAWIDFQMAVNDAIPAHSYLK